jgi:hypothetical protein
VERASNKVYEVKCPRTDCPFHVYASEGKWSKQWKCAIVVDHMCVLHELEVLIEYTSRSTTSLNQ